VEQENTPPAKQGGCHREVTGGSRRVVEGKRAPPHETRGLSSSEVTWRAADCHHREENTPSRNEGVVARRESVRARTETRRATNRSRTKKQATPLAK
jgi:hypothetical protein